MAKHWNLPIWNGDSAMETGEWTMKIGDSTLDNTDLIGFSLAKNRHLQILLIKYGGCVLSVHCGIEPSPLGVGGFMVQLTNIRVKAQPPCGHHGECVEVWLIRSFGFVQNWLLSRVYGTSLWRSTMRWTEFPYEKDTKGMEGVWWCLRWTHLQACSF